MMGFSNAGQTEELLLFGGVGFLLGVYSELFYMLSTPSCKRSWRTVLRDILFFITASLVTFVFVLAISDGVVRWYLYPGLAIGFVSYRMTVGQLVRKAVTKVRRSARQFIQKAREKAKKFQKKS